MKLSFLPFLGLLLTSYAWANPQWDNGQSKDQTSQASPVPASIMDALRKESDRYSGTSKRILMAKNVRTGSGGGGGIACFPNDDVVEKVFDLGLQKVIPSQAHLISWLIPYDATWFDEKTQRRMIRGDLSPSYPNESAVDYLNRILDSNIAKIDADVAYKLKELINGQIHPQRWLKRAMLPRIDDNGAIDPQDRMASHIRTQVNNMFIKVDHPGCPAAWYVQLAIRYQFLDAPYEGLTVIDSDPYLLAVMRNTNAPLNPQSPLSATVTEALLILHEALYYALMKKHFYDSSIVMKVSGHLLSTNPKQLRQTVPHLAKLL